MTQRTDTQLKDAIVSEMEWTPSINSERIGVSLNHGAVTLCRPLIDRDALAFLSGTP